MAKIYRLFISHSWDHVDDLKNLKGLLEQQESFDVEFYEMAPENAINSDNSTYIKRCISARIGEADIVLGIAGIYASYSEWMQWELDKAKEKGKKIIGVVPWGQERISSIVAARADVVVRWNTKSIIEAIKKLM